MLPPSSTACYEKGKFGEAEPMYKRSLAINEKVLSPDHPAVATDLNVWAGLLESQVGGPQYLVQYFHFGGPFHPFSQERTACYAGKVC